MDNGDQTVLPALRDAKSEMISVLGLVSRMVRDTRSTLTLQLVSPGGGEGVTTLARTIAALIETETANRACTLSDHTPKGLEDTMDLTFSENYGYLGVEDKQAVQQGDLGRIITRLSNDYRVVILDSLPVLENPLSATVSGQVDGVVLVVESERTDLSQAEAAKNLILNSGGNLLGVILNKRRNHLPRIFSGLFKRSA